MEDDEPKFDSTMLRFLTLAMVLMVMCTLMGIPPFIWVLTCFAPVVFAYGFAVHHPKTKKKASANRKNNNQIVNDNREVKRNEEK